VSGIPRTESIQRMEQDGTMDRRRRELREWFAEHPQDGPADAVKTFGYTFADHMLAVADSIWMDMRRDRRASLALIRGGEEDPTVRLSRFRAQYPHIPVRPLSHAGPWQAEIPEEGSQTFMTSYELRTLLDRLAGLGYTLDDGEAAMTPGPSEAPDAGGGHTTSSDH